MSDRINDLMYLAGLYALQTKFDYQNKLLNVPTDSALHFEKSLREALEAALKDCRNATLEEAAAVCDGEVDNWFSAIAGQDACKDCAKEIRSLK